MYISEETDADHMPWLHGPGTGAHHASHLISKLSAEMRRIFINPRARPKSPLPRMREEMRRLAADHRSEMDGHEGSWIFASLDLETIGLLRDSSFSLSRFRVDLWNEIAPHLTPAHMDAYIATGRSLLNLDLRNDRCAFPSEETLSFIATAIGQTDHIAVLRLITGAKYGHVSAKTALVAVRSLLSGGQSLVTGTGPLLSNHLEARMVLRIIAALEFGYQDDWAPETDNPAIHKALELTRTQHGKLRLMSLAPDPEALIANPAGVLAALGG